MSPPWRVLLAALLTFALTGPDVSTAERAIAGGVLALGAAWARPRAGLFVFGAALGLLGALRLHDHVDRAGVWAGTETACLVRFVERIDQGYWRAELAHPSAGRVVARVSRVPDDVVAGEVRRAHARVAPLPHTRNPDDRRALRGRLGTGVLLRARLEDTGPSIRPGRGDGLRARVRTAAAGRWEETLGDGAALWRALLLADRRALRREAVDRVQQLGFAHLLALSGLHVGVVLGVIVLPLRGLGRRALLGALPVLALWVVVAGAGPSMVRAALMVAFVVVGGVLRERAKVDDALAVVGLLELALRPHVVCGVGWWLSYAATLAILRALPLLKGRHPLVAGLGVSVFAQLGTLPWILDTFGRLPLFAPVLLLAVGPLFTAVLAVGGACAVLGLLPLPGVAALAAAWAHAFGWVLARSEATGDWALGHPGFGDVPWALALCLVGWWLLPHRWLRPRRDAAVALTAILLVHAAGADRADHRWITFDVGQGDAHVYACHDRVVVVDTGPKGWGWHPIDRSVLAWLERRGVDGVTVVLTHSHQDHVAGTRRLLRAARVDTLVIATADRGKEWADRFVAVADSSGAGVRWAAAGDALWTRSCCEARVLWPPATLDDAGANDRSLVLRIGPRSSPVLATGDLERHGEPGVLAALEREPAPDTWILKVAHHGGDTGTDRALLRRLRPRWSLVSCGYANNHGHPHPALIDRLAEVGSVVRRTDRSGALVVRWDDGAPRFHAVGGGP
jgi:competence protein ComEC